LIAKKPGFSMQVHADGTIELQDGPNVALGGGLTKSGTVEAVKFGLTDAVMRALGEDPYLAEKLRIMDATRSERAVMAGREAKRLMAVATQGVSARLRRVWRQEAMPVAKRRELLFLLWDECGDTPSGRNVRDAIVHFISAEDIRFTSEEVSRFNRRRTQSVSFSPGLLAPLSVPPDGLAGGRSTDHKRR